MIFYKSHRHEINTLHSILFCCQYLVIILPLFSWEGKHWIFSLNQVYTSGGGGGGGGAQLSRLKVAATAAATAAGALRGAWPQRASVGMHPSARRRDGRVHWSLLTAAEFYSEGWQSTTGDSQQPEEDWWESTKQSIEDKHDVAAGWLLKVWIGYAVGAIHQEGIS